MRSLFNKFLPSRRHDSRAVIAIQPDAVYLHWAENTNAPEVFPIQSDWQSALAKALQSEPAQNRCFTVVLASQYYQILQIDTPKIPKNEWPTALPFLLKDLVAERPNNIIADAFTLPFGGKIQAYVMVKSALMDLIRLFDEQQLSLDNVLPEDEVWGHANADNGNFLLLQRSRNGAFKLSAFADTLPIFQRTLRAVTPPLTGQSLSDLQFDSVALELQRSIDYVSAQVKGVAFNKLKLSCDEEDHQQLISALGERIGASVSWLTESAESAQVLCEVALKQTSSAINLYPDFLRPKREVLTLNLVASVWLCLLLAGSGYFAWLSMNVEAKQAQHEQQLRKTAQLNEQVRAMQGKLNEHKPSVEIEQAIGRVEQEIAAKREALNSLSQYDTDAQQGYAGILSALAQLNSERIALTSISMGTYHMDLKGVSLTPQDVPEWVTQFQTQVSLVGRTFEQVRIDRNDAGLVSFELLSQRAPNLEVSQ